MPECVCERPIQPRRRGEAFFDGFGPVLPLKMAIRERGEISYNLQVTNRYMFPRVADATLPAFLKVGAIAW